MENERNYVWAWVRVFIKLFNKQIMADALNLPLRTEVLEFALRVEQNINSILLLYLSIDSEERKAITYKSGNLSFKNKIDLLFDLEILSKEEYKLFLVIMEFRNQFLHNADCISFSKAVSLLGIDKQKALLKFDNEEGVREMELRYRRSYGNMYKRSLEITLEKIQERKKHLLTKTETLKVAMENTVFLIDSFFNIFDQLFKKYEPELTDSKEVIKLKSEFLLQIHIEIEKVVNSSQYKSHQKRFQNVMTQDRLEKMFK